jgi:hypothetical protein
MNENKSAEKRSRSFEDYDSDDDDDEEEVEQDEKRPRLDESDNAPAEPTEPVPEHLNDIQPSEEPVVMNHTLPVQQRDEEPNSFPLPIATIPRADDRVIVPDTQAPNIRESSEEPMVINSTLPVQQLHEEPNPLPQPLATIPRSDDRVIEPDHRILSITESSENPLVVNPALPIQQQDEEPADLPPQAEEEPLFANPFFDPLPVIPPKESEIQIVELMNRNPTKRTRAEDAEDDIYDYDDYYDDEDLLTQDYGRRREIDPEELAIFFDTDDDTSPKDASNKSERPFVKIKYVKKSEDQ